MFADAVELLAAVLAAAWLGLLVRAAADRGRAVRTARVLASGAAVGLFGAKAVFADGIDDAGGGATALDTAVSALVVEHRAPALTTIAETLHVAGGLVGMTVLAVVAAAVLQRHRRRAEAAIVLPLRSPPASSDAPSSATTGPGRRSRGTWSR